MRIPLVHGTKKDFVVVLFSVGDGVHRTTLSLRLEETMTRTFSILALLGGILFASLLAGCASDSPNTLSGQGRAVNINQRYPTLPPQ